MSPTTHVKINPEVLRWARDWFNMSTDYVAKKMSSPSITEETIVAWENGDKMPTYRQLQKLADILEKPLEIFLYPSPPSIPKPSVRFRSIYGEYSKELPPEILKIIVYARKFQENLRDVSRGRNPAKQLITRNTFSDDVVETARKVRELINISLDEQKEFSSYPRAFEHWRLALSEVGIFVIKQPFRSEVYSGFCLSDSEFPVICVNNTTGHQRQIFTLFHELYHLIKGENGVDIIDDEQIVPTLSKEMQKLERECDLFAAEFLVPTDDFIHEVTQIPHVTELLEDGGYLDILRECVEPLAKKYCVSLDVIQRKLLDTEFIEQSRYYRMFRRHSGDYHRDPGNNGGGNYYSSQVAYMGRPYIRLVMESQEKYGYPDYVAAEYLDVSVKNLQSLLENAAKGDV